MKLFSPEAIELTKNIQKSPRERKPKEPSISDLKWEISKEWKRMDELEAQDESNFSDFDKSVKAKEVNLPLVRNHIRYYQDKIDKLREPFNPLLNKWKSFIIELCKEKNQEIELIWFDESSPYDCEIEIRLKGHRCWNSCVSLRFQEGKLKAYDSHFGGGTSSVWLAHTDYLSNPNIEEDKVKEIMENVFNRKCTDSHWEDNHEGHRNIQVDDKGWLTERGLKHNGNE